MRKIILGVVLVLMLLASSCSVSGGGPAVTPEPAYGEPPPEMPWISPGKVQVGNFYPGATAEWNITVHNGYQQGFIEYYVSTDTGQTTEKMVLPKGLKGWDTKNVVGLVSDNVGDKLVVKGYDSSSKELTVGGFLPSTVRRVSVTYEHNQYSTYSVYYKDPSSLSEGFSMPPKEAKDWVIVADPNPVLAPFETKDILISVVIPEKTLYSETFTVSVIGGSTKVFLSNNLYNGSTSYVMALSSRVVGESLEVTNYDWAKGLTVGNFTRDRLGEELLVSYYGVTSTPSKWEFWIGVSDVSQGGMVVTELCSRWLVSMKEQA